MSDILQPTLHKPVPMQSKVKVNKNYSSDKPKSEDDVYSGIVAGISSCHVLFTYLVILDKPIESDYGVMNCIAVSGPLLMNEKYEFEWRLDN